ncbi:MAG: sigma-54-dependent Fis family transcriptional regulator [Myxococcales bacterium 68-20]|mgnify:CR=1 FL=1|nr:MAG: sigma-54-dependent Fis family transcriptional regulator [Myxococcales bacterium 68-20]
MAREKVLLVDDDPGFRRAWTRILAADGFDVIEAASAPDALAAFERAKPRLVVLDLMLPPSGTPEAGAELLERMLGLSADAKLIVVSGTGETALSLALVRRGAYDFLAKPVDPDVLSAVLARAHARLALEDRVRDLETALPPRAGGPLGSAPAFLEAKTLATRAAASDVPVLLTGESGTGKEVFARLIHEQSRRVKAPFVAVNCGAITPTLLESTLFGHKRGAFTGATSDAKGLFIEADGGTLFLDEIGDLAGDLQVKLLRALEAREVLPVGASKPVQIDVRFVSATHRPLAELVAAKTFRDDLYWRVRGIEVGLPRLVDRPGDVLLLAQHFLNQARALVPGSREPRLSADAQRCLERHAWPGNLRELRNEMQRALVLSGGRSEILPEDLSPEVRGVTASPEEGELEGATLEEKVAALERREILRALGETKGNKSQTAERLGLSRQGLLNKMARFGIR